MSGIGFQELLLLFLIGLIVLGPERLPRVANQLGSWLGQARRMTRMMKRQLEEELDIDKGLGLKSTGSTRGPSSFERPSYVTDTTKQAGTEEPEDAGSSELPDDYSPQHGPQEPGTGVGDDADYADDDELEPTSRAGVEPAAAADSPSKTATDESSRKDSG